MGIGQPIVGLPGIGDGIRAVQGDGANGGNLVHHRLGGSPVCGLLLQLGELLFGGSQHLIIDHQRLLGIGQPIVGLPGPGNGIRAVQGHGADGGNLIHHRLGSGLVCRLLLQLGEPLFGGQQHIIVGHQRLLGICQGIIGIPGVGDGSGTVQGNRADDADPVHHRLGSGLIAGLLQQFLQLLFRGQQHIIVLHQRFSVLWQRIIGIPCRGNGCPAVQGDGADGGNLGFHRIGSGLKLQLGKLFLGGGEHIVVGHQFFLGIGQPIVGIPCRGNGRPAVQGDRTDGVNLGLYLIGGSLVGSLLQPGQLLLSGSEHGIVAHQRFFFLRQGIISIPCRGDGRPAVQGDGADGVNRVYDRLKAVQPGDFLGGEGIVVNPDIVQQACEVFPPLRIPGGAQRQGAVVFHTRGHSVGHSLTVQIEGAAAAGPVLNRGHQNPLVQRRFDSVADIVVPMGAEVEGAAPLGAGQAQAVPAAAGILALAQDGHPVVSIVRHIDPGGQGKALCGGKVQIVGVGNCDDLIAPVEADGVANESGDDFRLSRDGAAVSVSGGVGHRAVLRGLKRPVGHQLRVWGQRRLRGRGPDDPEIVDVGIGPRSLGTLLLQQLDLQGVFRVLQHAAAEDLGADDLIGLIGVDGVGQFPVDVDLRLAVLKLHAAEDLDADTGKGQFHRGAGKIIIVAGAVVALGIGAVDPESLGIGHPAVRIVNDLPGRLRRLSLLGLGHQLVDMGGHLGGIHLLHQNPVLAIGIGFPGVGAVLGVDGDGARLHIPPFSGPLHRVHQGGQIPALPTAGGVAEVQVVTLAHRVVLRHLTAGVAGDDLAADLPAAPEDGDGAVGLHIDGRRGVKAHIVLRAGGEVSRHNGAQLNLLAHQLHASQRADLIRRRLQQILQVVQGAHHHQHHAVVIRSGQGAAVHLQGGGGIVVAVDVVGVGLGNVLLIAGTSAPR